MARTLRKIRWQWLKALRFWDSAPIRAQGTVTVMIPIIAILVSFASGLRGNWTRAATEEEIQRKFQVVLGFNALLAKVRTVETSERDYLLTKHEAFRDSVKSTVSEIPAAVAELRTDLERTPDESERTANLEQLDSIQGLLRAQVASLERSRDLAANGADPEALSEHLENRARSMRQLETVIASTQAEQAAALKKQVEDIAATRYRDYSVLFLALFVGIGTRAISLVLFDKGIVRRINRMTISLASIRNGERVALRQPKKKDAIGLLEQEIVNMAKKENVENDPDQTIREK